MKLTGRSNLLHPCPLAHTLFHWKGMEGTAEISDLGIKNFGRVWNDACDVGVTVIGKREEVVFVVVETEYAKSKVDDAIKKKYPEIDWDNDKEIACWHLSSVSSKNGKTDNRFKLTIFND